MKYSILHIDTDEEFLQQAKQYLELLNPNVKIEYCTNTACVLEKIRVSSYAIIISNFFLPDMTALQLLQKIKSFSSACVFILFTEKINEDLIIEALNEGVHTIIRKRKDNKVAFIELNHFITQYIENEKQRFALLESEEKFRTLAENTMIGFWHVAIGGKTLYLNSAMKNIFEITNTNEVNYNNFTTFLSYNHRDVIKDIREKRNRNGKHNVYTFEATIITQAGNKRTGIFSSIPIKATQNTPESLIGTFIDITDLRLAEEALRESEERFRTLTDLLPIPIIVTQLSDGVIVYANKQMEQVTGIPLEKCLGQQITNFYYNPIERQNIRDLLKKHDIISNYEMRIKSVNESVLWVLVSVKKIKYKNIDALLSVVSDITDRKETEITKQRYQEQLQREREELSSYSNIMAHDLRNMLSAIAGYASLLELKGYDLSHIKNIQRISIEALTFLNRSLELAEAGLVISHKEKIDLNDIINQVIRIVIPNTTILNSDKLPYVFGDRDKVYQIFKNLVENAIIHGKASKITILYSKYDTITVIRINNDGLPISDPIRDALNSGTTHGLGYKIVRKLIDAHGWNINLIKNEETTFEISIPNNQIISE